MEEKQNLFAKRLRKLKERKGVSYQTLADLCGLSRETVRKYVRGERRPSVQNLNALADYFDVSIDYLLGRSD